MRVLISGAGIAGLSAAGVLAAHGVRVTPVTIGEAQKIADLFERSPQIRPEHSFTLACPEHGADSGG